MSVHAWGGRRSTPPPAPGRYLPTLGIGVPIGSDLRVTGGRAAGRGDGVAVIPGAIVRAVHVVIPDAAILFKLWAARQACQEEEGEGRDRAHGGLLVVGSTGLPGGGLAG